MERGGAVCVVVSSAIFSSTTNSSHSISLFLLPATMQKRPSSFCPSTSIRPITTLDNRCPQHLQHCLQQHWPWRPHGIAEEEYKEPVIRESGDELEDVFVILSPTTSTANHEQWSTPQSPEANLSISVYSALVLEAHFRCYRFLRQREFKFLSLVFPLFKCRCCLLCKGDLRPLVLSDIQVKSSSLPYSRVFLSRWLRCVHEQPERIELELGCRWAASGVHAWERCAE